MSDVRALPLAGERFTSDDVIEVHSPYNGAVIGAVPACAAADVDRAVATATAALHERPLPAWKRAEILDRAAALLAERTEQFGRTIADEAAKPHSSKVEITFAAVSPITSHTAVRASAPAASGGVPTPSSNWRSNSSMTAVATMATANPMKAQV